VRLWRELRGAAQSRQRSQRGAYKLANRGPRCRSARSHAARGRLVRLVRRKEDIESRMHDFVGTLDTLPRAQHPDPADHRINGDDLLKRRLATHQGVLIQFRSRDDKREKLLPRDRSKRSRSTRACATMRPSDEPGGKPAHYRSGQRRQRQNICHVHGFPSAL